MKEIQIYRYVSIFRKAIDKAKEKGQFKEDKFFSDFPNDCCGDTCCLLAEYLRRHYIETLYVWGENLRKETHAWLIVKDDRIKVAYQAKYVPKEIIDLCNFYGGDVYDWERPKYDYDNNKLVEGLLIDITTDQFGKMPVYVGKVTDFYFDYKWRKPEEHNGLPNQRLEGLYKIIEEFCN